MPISGRYGTQRLTSFSYIVQVI